MRLGLISSACFITVLLSLTVSADIPAGYNGNPFRNQIQSIPGVIYPWRYDSAGVKNITWSYPYPSNRGDYHGKMTAGVEDPVGLKRLTTAWDHMSPGAGSDTMIHYTDSNNIYLGYIETGEWVKMTLNVAQTGTYQFDAMVTACCAPNSTTECINPICDPTIRIDFLDGSDSVSTGPVTLTKTGYYHNYMYEANLARVNLRQGLQLHKITVLGTPPANLWYFKYTLVNTPVMERRKHFGALEELRTERIEPTRGGATIVFRAAGSSAVSVEVFDARGKLLVSGVDAVASAGLNRFHVSGLFGPGAVMVKLTQGHAATVSRMPVAR
jgi:hypothetical protein